MLENSLGERYVIHVIRDPRGILASWKNFTNAPGNDYLDSILKLLRLNAISARIYDNNNYVVIKYEDLVSNTQETVKSLCKKIGVEFDISMLDVNNFTDRLGNKWKANTAYNIEINGISKEMIEKWKSKLDEWEVFLTENIMRSLLDDYNYESFGLVQSKLCADKVINEVQKSKLVSEGFIRYLITNESFERYPTDPSDLRNWGAVINNKSIS